MESARTNLKDLLTEDQIQTVNNAVENEFITSVALGELVNHETYTTDEKRNILIDTVIVPYNMAKLENDINEAIENGKVASISVGGDGETPLFIYTVGGIPIMGGELLLVGNIPPQVGSSILNVAFEAAKEKGEVSGDLGTLATLEDGDDLRYLIKTQTLGETVKDFLNLVPKHFPDAPLDTPVYVIEVGDENNLLPGEEGYDETFIQYSHLAKDE